MEKRIDSPRFENKVVMVTGAASGIGFATAKRFASEGANLLIADLPGADFETAKTEIDPLGRKAIHVEMDVSNPQGWREAVNLAEQEFGGIDILVNNAGISGPRGRLSDIEIEDFDKTMIVNVRSVFLGMQAVIESMRKRGGGSIVNVSSVSGERGNARVLPYVTSKHAVNGMSQSAALDLVGEGIRVNVVAPYLTNTNMVKEIESILANNQNLTEDQAHKALSSSVPMGRYGEPAEIAALIAFLCSDEASFMTGAIVPIDGGVLSS